MALTHGPSGKALGAAGRAATVLLVAAAVALPGASTVPAVAQDRTESGSFLLLRQLFRAPEQRDAERPRKQKPAAVRPRKKKARKKQGTAAASVVRSAPPEPAPVKGPDARTVLVVGDFLGGSLGEGLEQALSGNATVKVVDRTEGDSGLVRDDVVNWPERVAELIEAENPVAVVAMLGSNDRQAMRIDGESVAPRDPVWTIAYEERAESLGRAVAERDIPLLWVGLPSFKSPKMSADILAFNDIYRTAAESTGGAFIDVWEGFVDESGAFTATGPDVNGQPARLRGNDGINLTRAGKRKLAFYVEKPLQKVLAAPQQDAVAALRPSEDTPFIGPPLPPAGAVDRTEPLPLGAPRSGETELLRAAPDSNQAPAAAAPAPAPSPEAAAVLPDPALPATPARTEAVFGRADNFFAIR